MSSETDWIIPAAFIYDRVKDIRVRQLLVADLILSSEFYPHSLGEHLLPTDIRAVVDENGERLSDLIEAIYAKFAERAGAEIAGDKSPNDLHFIRILGKVDAISPAMKVIHIVRDVRDVVARLVDRNLSPGIETQYARMWSAHNLYLNTWLDGRDNYRLIRYEDFVSNPEAELRSLPEFLGQNFDPVTLDPDHRHSRHRPSPVHDMLYRPISTEKIGNFRQVLSADLIARCELQASEGMAKFGYEPID